jgi:hypothetical protein
LRNPTGGFYKERTESKKSFTGGIFRRGDSRICIGFYFGFRIEFDPLVGFAAAIFGAVAGIFKLGAFSLSAGDANGDIINGIMSFHVAGGVHKFNSAAADKAGTTFDVLPAISQTSALRLAPGHGKMANIIP